MVFWCILFWILAHKHENHKWMFFIGFNGGLASGFSTKKPSDGWSHGPSVYLNIPKEMAETPWYFNKFQTMDGRLYFKRGGLKKTRVFGIASLSLNPSCMLLSFAIGPKLGTRCAKTRRATETTWAQFHSTDEAVFGHNHSHASASICPTCLPK